MAPWVGLLPCNRKPCSRKYRIRIEKTRVPSSGPSIHSFATYCAVPWNPFYHRERLGTSLGSHGDQRRDFVHSTVVVTYVKAYPADGLGAQHEHREVYRGGERGGSCWIG